MHDSVKLISLLAAAAVTLPTTQAATQAQEPLEIEVIPTPQLKQTQLPSEPPLDQSGFSQGRLEEGDQSFTNTQRRFDAYGFDGKASETIQMTVISDEFVPVISLIDETTGEVISREAGEAGTMTFTQELPRDGRYTLFVSAPEVPGEGSYQFRIVTIREVPQTESEADRLLNQGYTQAQQGQFEVAIQFYEQALTLYREIDNRDGEVLALVNLGLAYNALSQYEDAISFFSQTLTLIGEGNVSPENRIVRLTREQGALGGLAVAYRELGQYEQAIALFQQQIPILQELEDRFEEGRALGHLGIAYRESDQYEQAIEVLQQRIDIAREIGDRAGEGSGFGNLGLAYAGSGQYEQAIEAYEQRLAITRELNQSALLI